jgi:hypothetical protein
VRETFDCAVVVVHHCGVDSNRPRGHTSLPGAVEAQLAVKRDAANNVVLTVEWMKDGPEGNVLASRLEQVHVGSDEDDQPVTSCVVVPLEGSQIVSPKTTATMPKAARIALDALVEALDEQGTAPR